VVTVWDGDQPLGQVTADDNGEWVLVVDQPMRSGSRQLSLIAEVPGQAPVQSASVVVVVVPDCAKPGPEPEREQAIAVLTPRKGGASKVLQPPVPKGDTSEAKGLSLDSVDYDDKGEVVLSGRAEPGTSVRAYVNNQPVGETKTSPEGDWQVKPSQPVDPGVHKLRIDQVEPEGKVVARVQLPFSRADPSEIVIAAGHVVVQPGNSLWRIARRTYGEGLKFTVIYQANKQSIADPDLIYPGQIFSLPQVN
jgi:LysM repeat protein